MHVPHQSTSAVQWGARFVPSAHPTPTYKANFRRSTLADTYPGECGFAELRKAAPGISHKMLSQTLRHLIDDGLVSRRVEGAVPPRTWYSLTVLGRTLDEPLAAVRAWAEANMPAVRDARRRER